MNPAEHTQTPPTKPHEKLFLDHDEVDRLAAEVAPRYRTLTYVLAYGGLRWGEAAALRRYRVDLERGRIEIAESLAEIGGRLVFGTTKSGKDRTITIPRFVTQMTREHLAEFVEPDRTSLVFTASNGAPLRNSNFAKYVWKPAVLKAGLPTELRIHDLRHTAAALMVREGAHPEAIKRHLGHSSIIVTMDTYGHLFPSEAGALAEALNTSYHDRETDKRRTKGAEEIDRTLAGEGENTS